MKMKKLKSKGIRIGTLIEIALLIAVLLVMLLPGRVVITPIGIPSLDSGVVLASPATERQSPDTILEITNLTPNDVTYIQDDPDGPDDGNWLTRIGNNVDTVCRVSFPTPTGNPTVGADLQGFKIWVRQQPSTAKIPQVRIDLYENGAFVATIMALTDVTSDTGQLFSATWNANLLGTADGSLVECYIFGDASPQNTVEVGAVEWNVDYTPPPPSILNTPDNYAFGLLAEEATANTTLTYFTVINNGSSNVTITIGGTDMTGDFPWTLDNDAIPGEDIYGLMAGLAGTSYNIIVRRDPTYNTLVSNLAASANQSWGLKLYAPTEFSGGGQVSGNVTLTIAQS